MSLQLTWWIACVIVTLSVVAGGASFSAAYHEANRLQDGHLREIGALIDAQKSLQRPQSHGKALTIHTCGSSSRA